MLNFVIGRREKGKTTLAAYMAGKVPRRLIFDPRGRIQRSYSLRVTTGAQLAAGVDALRDGDVSEVVYTPISDDLDHAFREFAAQVKAWVLDEPVESLAVLVDEIAFVDIADPAFAWVLKCSPRDVVHIFLTCHRPADIPTAIRSIGDRWFVFQVRQEHDLKVLSERCSPATAARVEKLKGREFVYWDDERAELRTYGNSDAWYVVTAPA